MKKSTREFIQKLLDRELKQEFYQQNPNPLEVEYVQDLIDASKDFAKCYGDWTDRLNTANLIQEILTDEPCGGSGGI